MHLSPRFENALQYATVLHSSQLRKATGVPYIAHLLGVTSIVLEYGGNEDEAIGALLHDAVEDQGGQGRLEDIRVRFGEAVADIVEGCTDSLASHKPPWRERKEQYIAHLPQASASVRLVSAADKLYNSQATLRNYRQVGEAVWSRFSGGKAGTLWYFRALVAAFRPAGPHALVDELDRVVTELEKLSVM
jgi:(p)ppGpp synthase/HD superfamily hydrolase